MPSNIQDGSMPLAPIPGEAVPPDSPIESTVNNPGSGESFSKDFGGALSALRAGKAVYREGWNGKGMFLYLVPSAVYDSQTEVAKKFFGSKVPYNAYIAMKTVDGTVVPWCPSQTCILADDWEVLLPLDPGSELEAIA